MSATIRLPRLRNLLHQDVERAVESRAESPVGGLGPEQRPRIEPDRGAELRVTFDKTTVSWPMLMAVAGVLCGMGLARDRHLLHAQCRLRALR